MRYGYAMGFGGADFLVMLTWFLLLADLLLLGVWLWKQISKK